MGVTLLPALTPAYLVAALEEMEGNIHEHSQASKSGVLAFRAARDVFELVAADRGIGVLATFRSCPEHEGFQDHEKALEAALTEGTSPRHRSQS